MGDQAGRAPARPGPDGRRLQVIAHRAGNDPAAARAALLAGADAVEADVYVFRGRIEVRHARTLGPWWSRRFEVDGRRPRLIAASEPRLVLQEIVDAAGPDAPVMLDIKGAGRGGGPAPMPSAGFRPGPLRALAPTGARWAAAVGAQVAAAWADVGSAGPLIVSAEAWPALGAFLDPATGPGVAPRPRAGVTVVLSAGTARQAAVVARRAAAVPGAGIGLPARLLDAATAAAMREVSDTLFCWGLTSPEQVRRAREWGVTHVIVDDLRVALGQR